MGKLESQHVAAEPEGEQLVISDLPAGFDERENTECLRVRLYQDGYPIPGKDWAGLCGEQVQKLLALKGLRLWVAKWPSGPGPGAKVAEPVFDADRTFAEPMKGIHDALLALTRRQRRP